MKRMSTVLAAVAMMVGAFGAMGCKHPVAEATQPEAAPVAQPVEQAQPSQPAATEEKVTVVASAAVRAPAPPALRVEVQGRAPSAHHVWQRGYWRYDGPRTTYVWVPGYWENTAVYAPYAPPIVRYEDPGYAPGYDYAYVPGYWRWSGVEYVWYTGHWARRDDCGHYYRPRWANVNGRWAPRAERWSYQRAEVWAREHRAARPQEAPRHAGHNPPDPQRRGSPSAPPAHHQGSPAAPPSQQAATQPAHRPNTPPPATHRAAPQAAPVARNPAVARPRPAVVANRPALLTTSPRPATRPLQAPAHRGRG